MPTPRRPRSREPLLPAALALVAIAAGAAAALGTSRRHGDAPAVLPAATPASWSGVAGGVRAEIGTGGLQVVVLRAPSLADRVAAAGGRATAAQEKAWTEQARQAQQAALGRLRRLDPGLAPVVSLVRVLNAFSARVDPAAGARLESSPDVLGVYPVRIAYPASLSTAVPGRAPTPVGTAGKGATVALLDTAVDASQPALAGRVAPAIDLVGGSTAGERHGTEIAGIVAQGAPGARLLPIRVATSYARSDLLLAGLERAVDPNGDGDAHDATRVALAALAEPFASFPDAPEARAVAGATALGTLVVAPAGNDGPAAAASGSIAGPGGAPDALTVGALDTRGPLLVSRLVLRAGARVLFSEPLPLLGAAAPTRPLQLPIVATSASPAGGAVLVSGQPVPGRAAERAQAAGARAVLLYGADPPARGLGLAVPVLALPDRVARAVADSFRLGDRPELVLGAARPATGGGTGGIAAFSSRGSTFGGAAKPDVLAPGTAVVTAEPGGDAAVANGTSAAAAAVAAAAARLAAAWPGRSARELRAAVLAHPDPSFVVPAPGAAPRRLPGGSLLSGVRLAPARLVPSDARPAVLSLAAGRVDAGDGGAAIVPVLRLDVELWRGGRRLGLLARLRDVLPGTYSIGLTGRGPNGQRLPPGGYDVRVVAIPVDPGARAGTATVALSILPGR